MNINILLKESFRDFMVIFAMDGSVDVCVCCSGRKDRPRRRREGITQGVAKDVAKAAAQGVSQNLTKVIAQGPGNHEKNHEQSMEITGK